MFLRQFASIFAFLLTCLAFDSLMAAQAIARWNMVPYEEVTFQKPIGVVAFHKDGIKQVDFRIDGGTPIVVTTMTYNPYSKTVEYWFTFNATRFSDGLHTISARVIPNTGEARDLPSLPIFSNANGGYRNLERFVSSAVGSDSNTGSREQPFKTISRAIESIQAEQGGVADGATVNLLAGDYSFSSAINVTTQNRFLTIKAAHGTLPYYVKFKSGSAEGFRTKLVKLQNLLITPPNGSGILNTNDPMEDYLWIDSCAMIGAGRKVFGKWLPYGSATPTREIQTTWTGVYITNTNISKSMGGPEGITLARNVYVNDIGSDAFSNTLMVINSSAENIDHRGTVNPYQPNDTFHPDVYQFYGVGENVILYNVRATSNIRGQGLFAGNNVPVKNAAFVNVQIDNQPDAYQGIENWGRVFLFSGPVEHMYVLNSSFKGPANFEGAFSAIDIVFQATSFYNWQDQPTAGVSSPTQSGITYLP